MILKVTDREGRTHALAAEKGWRVMEVIRDHAQEGNAAVAIKAECGGCLSCATCHVYVEGGPVPPPPSAEELEMLDGAFDVRENSRLSCQILMSEELDGLHVTLAPGSEP